MLGLFLTTTKTTKINNLLKTKRLAKTEK